MARLSLYLLGPTRVEQDGKPVVVDTHKAIALLAYLATTGKGQRRDALIGLLWPESDPAHAHASLRRELAVLRGALAGDWLHADREIVSLPASSDIWSDVEQFHTLLAQCQTHGHPSSAVCSACLPVLAQAAALHRGDFMANFGLKDSPDFDDWQVQQADVLRSELSRTLEMLVQGHLGQGDLESALAYARQWLALDRLNEAAHAQLMRLHVWSGRRAAALRQYQDCVDILHHQLGVAPQDEITALYQAIRDGNPPPSPVRKDAPTLRPAPGPETASTAPEERRIVTALCADAGGGLTEARGLSLQEAASLVQQLLGAMQQVADAYGAHTVRSAGASLLAVFGATQTHESDPEQAIRAALEMRDQARKLGLSLSAGIAFGEAYASRTAAIANEQPRLMGRPIDLALRLAALATSGHILVLEPIRRAARRAFAFAPLELALGAAKPTVVYQVQGLLLPAARARGSEGMQAKLTGRDDELAKLKAALERVCRGQGQMVSLIGEAGVGKSRLVAELREHALAGGQPLLWLEGRCLDVGVAAGYTPFLDILRAYFAWTPQDGEHERRARIVSCIEGLERRDYLAQARAGELAALLCRLFSLPVGDEWHERLRNERPDDVRYRTFMALRDFLAALARQKPLVLVFEDLHWADDLSLDLLALLMQGLGERSQLLLYTHRPEEDRSVRRLATIAERTCRDCYSELRLRELTHEQSQQLVASLLAVEALPPLLRAFILSRTQGNPFFLEETVRSLIDADVVYRDGECWRARAEIGVAVVPDSVQRVILSRVDRLPEETRRVLEAAAVIGCRFHRRVLMEVVENKETLARVLDDLTDRAFVYQERTVPEIEYSFKHVLTQQAVYDNILGTPRARLHEQIAGAIENTYRDDLAAFVGQLAYHYDRSGNVDKAIAYLFEAARQAQRQSAYEAAISHGSRALELLKSLPPGPQRDRQELDLLAVMFWPVEIRRGAGSPDKQALSRRMLELAVQLGDTANRYWATFGALTVESTLSRHGAAQALVQQLLSLAEASGDRELLAHAHSTAAIRNNVAGNFGQALRHVEQGLALFDREDFHLHHWVAWLLRVAGQVLWPLGYPDQAAQRMAQARALSQQIGLPQTIGNSLLYSSQMCWLRREPRLAEEWARSCLDMATEFGAVDVAPWMTITLGWALAMQGTIHEGKALIQAGRETCVCRGLLGNMPIWLAMLAEACMLAGQTTEALAALDEALRITSDSGERRTEADLRRLKGEVLLLQGADTAEAEGYFRRALEIARSQNAKGWELRAATSLARWWQKQGRCDEARTLLQGVYGWFTEGFETADLKDARALLDALE